MLLVSILSLVSCRKYAVLYAGSNFFLNYRHQADIYFLRKILLGNGFRPEDIIVYAYDDIAQSSMNLFRGDVFHDYNRVNIYPGSAALNYTGNKVNAHSFHDALLGLPTGPDDDVLIYYDNHGGEGILYVPDGNGDPIYADDLAETFNKMRDKKLFKNLFFVIEACYSGSIGAAINTPNVMVMTAANAIQNSWGALCDDDEIGSCLTNEFSMYVFDEIQKNTLITVSDLFKIVKENTKGSDVCFFGDPKQAELPISAFFGIPHSNGFLKSKFGPGKVVVQTKVREMALKAFLTHKSPEIVRSAKEQLVKIEKEKERLRDVLSKIAKAIDPSDNLRQRISIEKVTKEYLIVLKKFFSKYGQMDPDDTHMLGHLKYLVKRYGKDSVISAIDIVL